MNEPTITRPVAPTDVRPKEMSAVEARAEAQRIAFGPILFQACWYMQRKGLFDLLARGRTKGLSREEILATSGISSYALTVLIDMTVTGGVLWEREGRFGLTKVGLMLAHDRMTKVNMDFTGDVCYEGMAHLPASLDEGRPAGLQVFGDWPTVYRALSELPEHVRRSWFDFDHYYSDHSFPPALDIVFREKPGTIMDVGGNTGKWAISVLRHDPNIKVVVVDLPGQLKEVVANVTKAGLADRLSTAIADMLDPESRLPEGADVIWMSQFLDCFSEDEVVAILRKAHAAMGPNTAMYIMETFIDRQRWQAASFSLAATSLYFTAMANGNSRMYRAEAFLPLIERAGLRVTDDIDDVGMGHTVLRCVKA